MSVESILVPTDGSEGAMAGARRAIELAAAVGADLHVLSVVDTREIEPAEAEMETGVAGDPRAVLSEHAERISDAAASQARGFLGRDVRVSIETGVPVESINAYVETHRIDLICMGTKGRTGIERVLLGSVAEKTLRSASVPVLTVSPAADIEKIGQTNYDDILLPTDGSQASEQAVEWGIDLAVTLDATVHALYSVDTRRYGNMEDVAAIHEALERTGRDALDRIRDAAGVAEVPVTGHLASGSPANTVLANADELDVDLITMGTHGRSGVNRYLIGSVAETVVRRAAVPVCSVPIG